MNARKWQYKCVGSDAVRTESDFNSIGADGWELVCQTTDYAGYPMLVFKRPCDAEPAPIRELVRQRAALSVIDQRGRTYGGIGKVCRKV